MKNHYGGGVSSITQSYMGLNNVTINGNTASEGGGVFIGESHMVLNNVIISNNTAIHSGGGIYCIYSSDLSLVNVTLVSNSANISSGGIYCESSSLSLINGIIWNNSLQEIYGGGITVTYSDIQGGYDGEGNIDSDPLFTNPENGDYTLQPNSPCIDAGTPFFVFEGDTLINMSENEYIGIAPDMGAFEYESVLSTTEETVNLPTDFQLFECYPNPFNPTTIISFTISEVNDVILSVYNIRGKLIETIVDNRVNPGDYNVSWNANKYSSGIYFAKLQVGVFSQIKKITLIK